LKNCIVSSNISWPQYHPIFHWRPLVCSRLLKPLVLTLEFGSCERLAPHDRFARRVTHVLIPMLAIILRLPMDRRGGADMAGSLIGFPPTASKFHFVLFFNRFRRSGCLSAQKQRPK